MAKRKIDVKKSIGRITLLITIIALIIWLISSLFNSTNNKSTNEGARIYKDKSCTVFYPDNKEFKRYAKKICDNSNLDGPFDYVKIPYGDYYLVRYPDNTEFLMDKDNNPLVIDKLSNECKEIVSDYLRYTLQKEDKDEYFTLDFYEKTYYKNLDISNAEVSIDGTNVVVYLSEFDCTVSFPITIIQDTLGINLGQTNNKYTRPHFVSKTRKTIVFTFNDGPSIKNSTKLIDTLYEYGANATFFILGNRINQEAVDMMKDSIEKGNEYGSHTENGKSLLNLNEEEILNEIMSPANVLFSGDEEFGIKGIDYSMKYYRAPFDARNSTIDKVSPLISIRWDIDSYDWSERDADKLYERLMELDKNDALDRQIVVMHDSYSETIDGVNKAIKDLAGKGYQFLNITEYLDLIGFDFNKNAY